MKAITPTLKVADMEETVRFYTEVLGFEPLFTLPGPDGSLIHASLRRGDADLMFGPVCDTQPHDLGPRGRGVGLYATVGDDEDIDAFYAQVKAAGAAVVQEPTDQFWGMRDWAIEDPDGYVLFLSKPTRDVTPEQMREEAFAMAPAD